LKQTKQSCDTQRLFYMGVSGALLYFPKVFSLLVETVTPALFQHTAAKGQKINL